jgi:hypothetical protein
MCSSSSSRRSGSGAGGCDADGSEAAAPLIIKASVQVFVQAALGRGVMKGWVYGVVL